MHSVELIMNALRTQIDDDKAYAVAVKRVTDKRENKESE
jgi:hypothetical protein